MSLFARSAIGVILVVFLFCSGLGLLKLGIYGWTVFLVYPMLLGALAVWIFRPETGWAAAWYGFAAVVVASGLLLVAGIEGAGCLIMALPITLPLAMLGGWFMQGILRSRSLARGGMAMLLILPPTTLAYDTHAHPPVYAVSTAITIDAPPAVVWRHIPEIPALSEPSEWSSVPAWLTPRARVSPAPAASAPSRTCDFSTGRVVEQIDAWEPGRLLRFRVRANPAPMREWSPWGQIEPKHLHGYFISREGEFRLTPLPGNRTLLTGTSWYQHGLWPAQYWRLWSDGVIHRIHLRVFRQIKTMAESDGHH